MKREPVQTTIFDICARKHRGNAESRAANPSAIAKISGRSDVYEMIARYPGGITSKEIATYLDKPLNAISGRISELKRIGLIETTGDRRDGAAVLMVKK